MQCHAEILTTGIRKYYYKEEGLVCKVRSAADKRQCFWKIYSASAATRMPHSLHSPVDNVVSYPYHFRNEFIEKDCVENLSVRRERDGDACIAAPPDGRGALSVHIQTQRRIQR